MVFVVWLFRPYRHHSHIIVVGIINVVVASSCWVVGVDGAGGGALGISNKKRIGGGGEGHTCPSYCPSLSSCSHHCLAHYPAQPIIACSLLSLVVVVVVAGFGLWCLVLVVHHGGGGGVWVE